MLQQLTVLKMLFGLANTTTKRLLESRMIAAGLAMVLGGCCNPTLADRGTQKSLQHMRVGSSKIVRVPACSMWTSTGVVVEQSELYRFESLPPDRWYDFFVSAPALGYDSISPIQARLEGKRRVPSARWFALCASIEPSGVPFAINLGNDQPITHNGELGLFANDLSKAYWNNWGSLQVRVTRIQ